MKNHMTKLIATTMGTAALVLGAQSALAQNTTQTTPETPPQAQSTPMQVDDKTVSNFVDAYTDVREIHSEYAEKLQSVEDPQQATNIQQEAQEKMEEAVTSNDMSVDEYMGIAQQIGQDAQLRSRIQAELEKTSGS